MFEKWVWHEDRVVLDDIALRLGRDETDNTTLGTGPLVLYKNKYEIDQYEWFFRGKSFWPQNVLELGIWDGGSAVFWFESLHPAKYVAVDLSTRGDNERFRQYVASRNLADRVRTYWGVDQTVAERLRAIVQDEFRGPLDLVIDDASHLYGPTKSSFEALFPLLRPGGFYIIEDWPWEYLERFHTPGHPWAAEPPLSKLIKELVDAAGSHLKGSIASLTIVPAFAAAERGWMELPEPTGFRLEHYISARPTGEHQ